MRFIVVLAVVCLGFASASLINILKTVHQNPTFSHLPHATQIIIIELIAETEAGELKNYIDLVGFQHVLAAIDQLPQAEAHLLRQYLIKELQAEEHNSTQTPPAAVGRRDLVALLTAVQQNAAFQHLSAKDQMFIREMLTAAENHNLTAFIAQVGYSAVLQVIEVLPAKEAHALNQYLFQHMMTEHGAHGVIGKKK